MKEDMPQELVTKLGIAEAEFLYYVESMARPPTKAALGIDTARVGGGVAISMRSSMTGYWSSRALGFGFSEPVTDALMDQVVEFYASHDSGGAVFQIAPAALPGTWPDMCRRLNITQHSTWIKLACSIDDMRPGTGSALHVGPVGVADIEQWAAVTTRGFGTPEEEVADMLVSSTTELKCRPFAAWDGDDMVATANLFIHEDVGALNLGTTLPPYRNRGAQSALIAARAKVAKDAGCRWLCAEARHPGTDGVNPSLNNLVRSGFRRLYDRHNWTWTPTSS